jgi:gamma-glutamylcyclotransferase
MPPYLAFGSNMHRRRLEQRVGALVDHGWVVLPEHRHGFTKLGSDGTGKGNIEPRGGCEVHGVLYELSDRQLDVLAGYEGGYERVELQLSVRGERVLAVTFRAAMWIPDLVPTNAYLDHYLRGMREHGLPESYVREVLAAARLSDHA